MNMRFTKILREKRLRNSGLEYTSSRGVRRRARAIGPGCAQSSVILKYLLMAGMLHFIVSGKWVTCSGKETLLFSTANGVTRCVVIKKHAVVR